MIDNFVFTISYYQKGLYQKKVIIVDLLYASTQSISDDQYEGRKTTPYNLTFNFVPLSHTELLI